MSQEAVNIKKRRTIPAILLLGFILGAKDGFVALWKDDLPEPIRVFSYSITSLPPADRQALETGIHIENREELLKLLEDYLS